MFVRHYNIYYPIMISSFDQSSRLIARIIACGYDPDTQLSELLTHIELYNSADTDDITSLISNTDDRRNTLTKIGINNAIAICDELCIPSVIRTIISMKIPNTVMSSDIINHTDTANTMNRTNFTISAYSHGYKLVLDDDRYKIKNLQKISLRNSLLNNMYANHYSFGTMDDNYKHKSLCKCDIVTQNAMSDISIISLCDQFRDIYRKTAYAKSCGINNIHDLNYDAIIPYKTELKLFTNLKKLYAKNNVNLPEYASPYLKSLIEVYIPCETSYITHHLTLCNNRDIALSLCMHIRVLDASNNPIITTCKPFAASLRILYATKKCRICDAGLVLCKRIKLLDTSDNPRITTCDPFATSLVKLLAGGKCGVGDKGLHLCDRLKFLHAPCNQKITMYKSFKKYSQNTIRKKLSSN